MRKAGGGLLDNEQAQPKPLGASSIEAKERFENALQLIRWDSLAGIMDLDANCWTAMSAPDKNAPSRRCVIERVAREISQNAIEQHRLAHDHCACRQRAAIDPFALRQPIEL